jgi:hypothetical protein
MSNTSVVVQSASTVSAPWEQIISPPRIFNGLLQKFVIHFDDIKFGRSTFVLASPIELTLEKVEGGWTCQADRFALFSFGPTGIAAVLSVFEDFAVLWQEIAEAPDDTLSEDAIRLKHLLQSEVKSITES